MEKGDISDTIQSEVGFHIVEVLDTKETDEDVGSFEDNEEEIRRTLAERKVNPEDAMEKINKLLEDADINIKIEGLDRKSTRLNSSHVAMSYAVFCLKKKIKKYKQ